MIALLKRCIAAIDACSRAAAQLAAAALLLACLISAGNAVIRYAFNQSSNAWLEIQWYLFAGGVMLGAPEVLRRNEHVRVDIFWQHLSEGARRRIDMLGMCVLLLPVMGLLAWLSWPFFWRAWLSGELSANAGGLLRWPAWLLLPTGFALLCLQALALALRHAIPSLRPGTSSYHPADYERPLQ